MAENEKEKKERRSVVKIEASLKAEIERLKQLKATLRNQIETLEKVLFDHFRENDGNDG